MAKILKEITQFYHRGQPVSMMYHKGKLVYDNSVAPPVPKNALYDDGGNVLYDDSGNILLLDI